jgi:hypothetical protein
MVVNIDKIAERAGWFGGLLEAGGQIGLRYKAPKSKTGSGSFFPLIAYGDNDFETIQILINTFGGSKVRKSPDSLSWDWKLVRLDSHVPEVATLIKPYAPSRERSIQAIEDWFFAETDIERYRIGQSQKGLRRLDMLEGDEYDELVLRGDFVSGVLDSRGDKESGSDSEYNVVRTKNALLLNTLADSYGGAIYFKHGSTEWRFGKGVMNLLRPLVEPYLLLKQVENGMIRRVKLAA